VLIGLLLVAWFVGYFALIFVSLLPKHQPIAWFDAPPQLNIRIGFDVTVLPDIPDSWYLSQVIVRRGSQEVLVGHGDERVDVLSRVSLYQTPEDNLGLVRGTRPVVVDLQTFEERAPTDGELGSVRSWRYLGAFDLLRDGPSQGLPTYFPPSVQRECTPPNHYSPEMSAVFDAREEDTCRAEAL